MGDGSGVNAFAARIMANKHTTGAAAVFAACIVLTRIGKAWWPEHAQQLDQTLAAIKDGAVMYGFTMAGDSNASNGNGKDDPPKPDNHIMKKITFILAIVAMALGGYAQTNAPVVPPPSIMNFDWLTNAPLQTNFQLANFEFSLAPVLKDGALENEIKGDFFVRTNYAFGLSGGLSPSTSVLNRASLHAGYRYAWPNADILIQAMGRRNWQTDVAGTTPSWQGGVNLDVNWVPMTGNHLMLGGGVKFLTSPTGNVFKKQPAAEFIPLKLTVLF